MKNDYGLTPQQESFAVGLAVGLTHAEAYRRAYPRSVRWKESSVWPKASKLASDGKVQARVAAIGKKAAAEAEVTAQWCADRWRQIVEADQRELSELRRGCCRYCWGKGFRYQRTAGEREREYEAWLALPPKKRPARFDEKGGIGYHRGKPANPDCPECFGDGVERTHFKDVRHLSPAARRLYQGVKETKDGIEIKTLDQAHALVQLSRMAGLYEKDNRQKSDPLVALLQDLSGNVFVPVDGAAMPEAGDGVGHDEGEDDEAVSLRSRIGVGYPAETEDPLSIVRAARAMAEEKLASAAAAVSFAEDELANAKVAKDDAARALRDLDAWLAAQELQR